MAIVMAFSIDITVLMLQDFWRELETNCVNTVLLIDIGVIGKNIKIYSFCLQVHGDTKYFN